MFVDDIETSTNYDRSLILELPEMVYKRKTEEEELLSMKLDGQ